MVQRAISCCRSFAETVDLGFRAFLHLFLMGSQVSSYSSDDLSATGGTRWSSLWLLCLVDFVFAILSFSDSVFCRTLYERKV